MIYSIVSVLALILNHIINRDVFMDIRIRQEKRKPEQLAVIRYVHFLVSASCYFIVDIVWGILYGHRDKPGLFLILYGDCVLYFLFMFVTMLTWIRYIVAYLDMKRQRSKPLLYAGWAIFTLGLVYLTVNYYHPFIFSFNARHEYIPEPGRHIAFILQIILYTVTSTYMLIISRRSTGVERGRYAAVGLTCLVMGVFLIMQVIDPGYPSYAMGLMIGICVVHSFVEAGEKKEKEVYDHIATGLAEDYEAMYYVDIDTGEFREFAASKEYEAMNVPVTGRDFYAETLANVEKYVHPDDREFARSLYDRGAMYKNLQDRKSFSYKYRIMVDGQPRYFRFTVMRAYDNKHFVLCEKDIDNEITEENMRLENLKKTATFSQIAESLAVNYDVIYYVDARDSSYISYECRNTYGKLDMQKSGVDFFNDNRKDILQIVHRSDCEQALKFFEREHLNRTLEDHKSCSIEYRIMAFKNVHYVKVTARKTADGTHFIIGIENIDAEVKREKQHLRALNTEKELARRDELTGVKNKNAYKELEKSIQVGIDNGIDNLTFALVVCDSNDLKTINDSQGHLAGDEHIRASAMLLCDIFAHSPVFRVGGDEFVVFLRGSDYTGRDELMMKLRERILENQRSDSGPILASGMSEYIPGTDILVSGVFERADRAMYKDKQKLKNK